MDKQHLELNEKLKQYRNDSLNLLIYYIDEPFEIERLIQVAEYCDSQIEYIYQHLKKIKSIDSDSLLFKKPDITIFGQSSNYNLSMN